MIPHSRYVVIKYLSWIASAVLLIVGLVMTTDTALSPTSQIYASIMVNAGGAFFFAITVGWAMDKAKEVEGYSALWSFSDQYRNARLLAFYADRLGDAEVELERAFDDHREGEILMAGPSLRIFLAPGQHYYRRLLDVTARRSWSTIRVRALTCDPENNHELPVRAFVESFNQDGSRPKENCPFDWTRPIEFSFEDFRKTFLEKYGPSVPVNDQERIFIDLTATRAGVKDLTRRASSSGNEFRHREYTSAPYCTTIIFPDKAFYTPNILCQIVPANMPMLVFHRDSEIYVKLRDYIEFLWWVSDRREQ